METLTIRTKTLTAWACMNRGTISSIPSIPVCRRTPPFRTMRRVHAARTWPQYADVSRQ